MRITKKIVLQLSDNAVLEHEWEEYNGPVALCTPGGQKTPKPVESASSKIISGLGGQISSGIQSQILDPTNNNNLTKRTIDLAVQNSNSQYGARGLAGSGIAQAGAERVGTDAALAGSQQQAQNIIGLLGAGSGNPTFAPQAQPRGLFGLK